MLAFAAADGVAWLYAARILQGLTAGLLVDYGPHPTRLVFWFLIGAFALALLAVLAVPETVSRDGSWRSAPAPSPGGAGAFGALVLESSGLFLVGGAVAGLGFGLAFVGVFRALSELAPADQRAGLISSVLTVSYVAFSIPAVVAGRPSASWACARRPRSMARR